jgi:RNA polymerase sigma-70 factor, ECF subfamily
VVQEVVLTLWRDPSRFDPSRGSLTTWLLTLIHRVGRDRRLVVEDDSGQPTDPIKVTFR